MKNHPLMRPLGRLIMLCLLTTFFNSSMAQSLPTQTIKGVVIDSDSESPVIAANVFLLDTEPALGAATNLDGSFRIEKVPVGRYSVRISCLGYEEAFINELEVGAGKEVYLTLRLQESLIKLEDVVVTGKRLNGTPNNDMASVSARSFSVEQTKRYAAAVNDPARMALSFAGVSNNDDVGNEIVVRGNSPRGVLWRMEGIEIPNPNHFGEQGASGGGISALSVNVLDNSDFLISAFPAEYGNAMSGVFDMRLRNGNNEKREYAVQAGVLGVDVAAEGPLGKAGSASYLVNYRYSTLAILEQMGVIDLSEGGLTAFQDAAFKVNVPLQNNSYLSVWGLGGLSSETGEDEFDRSRFNSDRGVVGINYRQALNDKTYVETILSYGGSAVGWNYLDKTTQYRELEDFTEQSLRLSALYNRKIDARNTLRAGVISSRMGYNFLEWYQPESSEQITDVDDTGSTYLTQAYAQWKHRFGSRLNINMGLHATHLAIENQVSLEPRAGMRWNYGSGKTFTAGVGLHSRLDPLPLYFANVPVANSSATTQANRGLALPKSAHFVLGHEWRFHPDWRWQAEVYYQQLYDVAITTPSTLGTDVAWGSALNFTDGFATDSLVSDGTGRNYGVEFTVERFFTDGWYALGTVSLYESKYTARDGIERDTRFNGRYVANALVGKEWTVGQRKVNILSANVRFNLAGGNRQSPIDLDASREAGYTVRDFTQAYAQQLPYFLRSDVRVAYRINSKRGRSSVLSLDLQNATNRTNLYRTYYSPAQDAIVESTQLGLIPILNYRLEF